MSSADGLESLADLMLGKGERIEQQRSPGPYLGFHISGLEHTTFEELMAASMRLDGSRKRQEERKDRREKRERERERKREKERERER